MVRPEQEGRSPLVAASGAEIRSVDTPHRWGVRALQFGLGSALLITLWTAWLAPGAIVLLPLSIAGLVAVWFLFRHPLLNLSVLLAGSVLILSQEPGIQLTEAVYGLYLLLYLAHWYGTRLLASNFPLIRSAEDRLALLVLGAVAVGTLLGLATGAPPGEVRGEAMALGMFALYFPIKDACFRDERAPNFIIGVVLWLGVFVSVRNFLHLEEILLAATQSWQIADARFATSETQLVVAVLAALLFAVARRSLPLQALSLGLFLLLFASLILTKSRAYWGAFLIAVVCVVFLMNSADRRRFLLLTTAGVLGTASVVLAFFGRAVLLLLEGVVRRFASLESAVNQDLSLINRFVETKAAWLHILDNPILGYGLGHQYSYHSLVYVAFRDTAFVHNGYVWLWLKLGLWGLVLFLLFYGRAIWCGLQVYRHAPPRQKIYGLWAAAALLGLAPAFLTSNGFPLPDVMVTHAIVVSLAFALKDRYVPSSPTKLHPAP